MSVRKELLERELAKLGFRKAGGQGSGSRHEGAPSSSQGDSGSSHPQADQSGDVSHAG